tara:strand:+ start:145 stop:426 length:282 start_codon:yes stop_codon:yes gene_type:complete
MTKIIATATLVLALGLAATGAQAEGRDSLTAGSNQSQVGLLLPAVQAAREAPTSSSSSQADSGSDLLIVNNGDGSDFLEAELRKFFRYITPME